MGAGSGEDRPFRGHLTRAQLVGLFAHLEANEPFRTRWVYSNIGYAAAGEVAAAAAGRSWEDLVTSRILEPLGMTASGYLPDEVHRAQCAATEIVLPSSSAKNAPARYIFPRFRTVDGNPRTSDGYLRPPERWPRPSA